MKDAIHWKLTLLRDKDWMPQFLVDAIDYLRYEVFYVEREY